MATGSLTRLAVPCCGNPCRSSFPPRVKGPPLIASLVFADHLLLLCPSSIQSLAMKSKSKDETSDTDSGIIVQSGPDSPMSPMKDLTQAMRKQQKALEERLEACVQELRRLCLREAELTGMLPTEYPLKLGEKPPKVRRRIGAAFRLDEKAILSRGADPLSTLERELALQLQFAEAARCLSREENLTKQVRKHRKSAVLKEEKKLKELQQALHEYRLAAKHSSQLRASAPALEGFCVSEESSPSDAALVEQEPQALGPHPPSQLTASAHLQPQQSSSVQPPHPALLEGQNHGQASILEGSPIQNSPWKETSLDKPYEKPKKSFDTSSMPSGPGVLSQPAPSPPAQGLVEPPLCHFVPTRKLELRRQSGSSAPPTPEFLGRRGESQLVRVCSSREGLESRGRSALPRRRPTYYTVTVPEYCFSAPTSNPVVKPTFHSASEDSNSDVSSISYTTSAGSSSPDISFLKPAPSVPTEETQSHLCKGHEAEYHCQRPQTLECPSGFFYAMEYVPDSHSRPTFLSSSAVHFAYREELVPVRFHRPVVSHSRVMRTPSLKDCPLVGPRVLSKSVVTEELKSWHERTRLRGARPHSLDRQGAFRMRSCPGRELRSACSMGQHVQGPRIHILKRSPEGTPVQVYVPENGEIITQV
ncbi:innate immunity activator protein [Varanus komodoensis]|uniref:innate immunity activator protein n=1 Tax=Varanus komodoensis TaxID=61221 RepID=UPI001CF7A4BE|nr:innate immunity activator protein [Varanus komodoensis]